MGSSSMNLGAVKGLVTGIVVILVMIILVPIMYTQVGSTVDEVQYSNGELHLDFNSVEGGLTGTGIDSDGRLTCGQNSGNHADCGRDKFTAVSSILSILPIVIAAGVIAVGGWWAVQSYTKGTGNNAMLTTGIVGAAITVVIALIVIPITFTPLADAINSAYVDDFPAAVPLLKLVPLILVTGAIAVAALLTGVVGSRGSMMKMNG